MNEWTAEESTEASGEGGGGSAAAKSRIICTLRKRSELFGR